MKKVLLLLFALFAAVGVKAQDPADVKVLLDTDFSVFTEGSDGSPKSLYNSDFNKLVTGYSYVSGVSAAGGKLLVSPSGYLQLNSFSDLPTSGGTLRVTAEVYMIGFDGMVQYQPGYSSSEYVNEYVEADKWVKVVSLVGNMRSTSRLKIVPYLSISGFYIKSLKVEYSPDFIAAPVAYLPADADGTQFTAACSVNSSATKYEADVFSYDKDGNEVYFEKNVELKKLTAYASSATGKITGLDPAVTYYYVARCLNANGASSPDSEVVKVVKKISSIAAPEPLPATDVTADGFTANWSAVDGAVNYIVNVYSTATVETAGETTVFDEDFSGVTVGTPESPEFSGNLNNYTHSRGWITDSNKTFASGYYVFTTFGQTGTLDTPIINLSEDEGKFRVVLKAAVRDYTGFKASLDTLKVELLDLNGDVLEAAPVKVVDQSKVSDYTFDFTKGVKDGRLRISFIPEATAETNYNKLFLDQISVTQNLQAGSKVERQLSWLTSDEPGCKVSLPLEEGVEYSYGVVTVGETVTGSGAYTALEEIESDESELVVVKLASSGVNEIETSDFAPKAWKESEGVLKVSGCNVVVSDLSGKILLRNVSDNECTFTVNYDGIVVVLADGKSYKFVL